MVAVDKAGKDRAEEFNLAQIQRIDERVATRGVFGAQKY
jgi:hypothetical protein